MSVVSSARRQKSWQIGEEIATLLHAMQSDDVSFGARLRRLSRADGCESDEDAARKIGVSYRQYQRWLSGESEPRGSSLKLIAEAFGVPISELVDLPDEDQLDRIEGLLLEQQQLLTRLLQTAERAEGTAPALDEPAPVPPGELGRRIADSRPSTLDPGRSPSRRAAGSRRDAGE
jgi:transcriptional regulator with XRE-family HTH domain